MADEEERFTLLGVVHVILVLVMAWVLELVLVVGREGVTISIPLILSSRVFFVALPRDLDRDLDRERGGVLVVLAVLVFVEVVLLFVLMLTLRLRVGVRDR